MLPPCSLANVKGGWGVWVSYPTVLRSVLFYLRVNWAYPWRRKLLSTHSTHSAFFFLLPFQELWWNGCCDRNTTKTKAFPSVFSERINTKICYHWTNVKLKTAIYTLKIQVWDTFFFFTVIYHACKIHANHFRIVYAVDHSLLLKNIISNKLHTHTHTERKVIEENWLTY